MARFLASNKKIGDRMVLIERLDGWQLWIYDRQNGSVQRRQIPVAVTIAQALLSGGAEVVDRAPEGLQCVMAK
jgi:hypothetical protein